MQNKDFKFGRAAETLISKWLQHKGFSVLPVYEKIIDDGKGPQLFTGGEGLVAPDFLTMKNRKVLWIEAKHKTAFAWYRIGKVWTTGIDLRHYFDYLKVAETTGFPIFLLFLHDGGQAKDSPLNSPSGLFGNYLDILSKNENHRSDRWGSSGMVYWTTQSYGGPLRLIAPLHELQERKAA